MNSFHDLLIQRHSIRKYTDEPIAADDVKTILEAGLMAPSSKRTMPWEFVLVEQKEMLAALSKCKDFGALPLAGCSLAVIVCADPERSEAWLEDASIAAVLMQLQAEDLGLGSCWVQLRGRFTADGQPTEEYIRSIISIPDNLQIVCAITLGHKNEVRKPFDLEKIKWEKVHIVK